MRAASACMALAFSMPPSIFSARSVTIRLNVGSTYFQNIASRMKNAREPQMMSYGAGRSGFGSSAATMITVSMALPVQALMCPRRRSIR